MGWFLGSPVPIEERAPAPGMRRRFESALLVAIIACPFAVAVLLLARSPWSALAVIAGCASVTWWRPFPGDSPVDRGSVIAWAFGAAIVTALVDTTIREVLVAMAGGGWYFPRPEREPLIWLVIVGIGVVLLALIVWIPMCLVGASVAKVHGQLHPEPQEPPAPSTR
jgi:hypothetical protein